ncbi:MAG: hypothetical protein Q8Q23_05365 [bacterium]|nr:hypothetical protein [bacterium]
MTKKEVLQEIIEFNRALQNRAKELNIRAGQNVFKIMSQNEWKEWLFARLGGAVSVETIADQNMLRLLELDATLVAQVLADNPDTLTVEGETLTVMYGKDWNTCYARTEVSEEFARLISAESVMLPSGRAVELRCGSYSAKTIKELVEKLEAARIQRCWQEARSQVEHTSWISDPNSVFPYLSELLTAVEVTWTDNGEGEPVIGFPSLYSDSDPDFQIRLREKREEAEKETAQGLERLLQKSCREALSLPREVPWYDYGTTELGSALQNRFKTLIAEYAVGLSAENIAERIAALKAAAEQAKTEIGGEYEATKQLLAATEEEVENAISSVDDTYFVDAEVTRARNLIKQAKDLFKSASYDEVLANCTEASELVGTLATLCTERSACKREAEEACDEVADDLYDIRYVREDFVDATEDEQRRAHMLEDAISEAFSERRYDDVLQNVTEARELIASVRNAAAEREQARLARFPKALWEAVDYDESIAESAVALAKEAIRIVGRVSALAILRDERDAGYGRERQKTAVQLAIPELETTEIGQKFFSIGRSSTLDQWLAGAVAWLETNVSVSPRERDLSDQLMGLKGQLKRIAQERGYGNRVEVAFAEDVDHKGQKQLLAKGSFTGDVQNRQAEGGLSRYNNQPAVFVCNAKAAQWMDYPPQAGEIWVCTLGFKIAKNGKGPVIVVNPQVRTDCEFDIQTKISRLEAELASAEQKFSDSQSEVENTEENREEALARLLAKLGQK